MSENNKIITGISAKISDLDRIKLTVDYYAAMLCEPDDFQAAGLMLKDLEQFFKEKNITFVYEVFDEKI